MVARGFPNGVWRSSGQLGHFIGFHGDTIFLEVIGRRVPEPESRSRRAGAGEPEPEMELERDVSPESRDFPCK